LGAVLAVLASATAVTSHQVDVVVPCYNEEKRFPSQEYVEFLEQNGHIRFTFVNDGSSDKTLEMLQRTKDLSPPNQVTVLNLEDNKGKAEATRLGMIQACASSDICGFWDGDLATPLYAITQFLSVMERKPHIEIVFGARVALLGRAIKRNLGRHYLGRIFATLASNILHLNIYDTQCGAKLFRTSDDLSTVLSRPFMSKWIFDVELLARYIGLRDVGSSTRPLVRDCLYEYPLEEWRDIAGSKLNLLNKVQGLTDLFNIWQEYFSPWRSWPPAGPSATDPENAKEL